MPSRQSARTQANSNNSYNLGLQNDRYQYAGSNTKSQIDSNSKSTKSASIQKLPEISMRQKLQMFHQRWEKQVVRHLPKHDRATLDNVYHVSEFCQ